MASIHVIDPCGTRREDIASEFRERNLHVEISEDLVEFARFRSPEGYIFAADDALKPIAPLLAQHLSDLEVGLPFALYASDPTPRRIVDGLLDGAVDYLASPFDPELLNRAFGRLITAEGRLSRTHERGVEAHRLVRRLTRRERDVFQHLAEGASNKEMATSLQISARTVEIHRANMMRKLGAQSQADALRIAFRAGLVE